MKTGAATRWLAIVPVIALAMVTAADTSAVAAGVTITDDSGVDFDAVCAVQDPQAPTPAPNSITSPGNPGGSLGLPVGGDGCEGVSLYDGSSESTDIREVSLASNGVAHGSSSTQLVASCTVDHPIPAAGSTALPVSGAVDLPSTSFQRAGCKVMFQNRTLQTNSPNPAYSCLAADGLHEHWADGFHFYIGFDVTWNGLWWVHSASIGTYDPSPTGGFLFQELGWSAGSWHDTDRSRARFGTNWSVSVSGSTATVTVDGVMRTASALCAGTLTTAYARAGDSIVNVKGVSTAEQVVALPPIVATDGAVLGSDVFAVGGFVFFSDATQGVSRNGGLVGGTLLRRNVAGIAYTPGPTQPPVAAAWLGLIAAPTEALGGVATMPDTLGPGPRCWTHTFGRRLPPNPLWVPNEPCHIDDDNIPHPNGSNIDPGERGTFLPEFWGTFYGFVA